LRTSGPGRSAPRLRSEVVRKMVRRAHRLRISSGSDSYRGLNFPRSLTLEEFFSKARALKELAEA